MSGRSNVLLFLASVIVLCACIPSSASASSYVLPYPSYMPGSKLYAVSSIIDRMKGWWAWGTIAQTKHALFLSDKYLVEAKTLFEYGQYLLATEALARSNRSIVDLPKHIENGTRQGKDMKGLAASSIAAANEHIRALTKLRGELLPTVEWNPEKGKKSVLEISILLDEALSIRHTLITDITDGP